MRSIAALLLVLLALVAGVFTRVAAPSYQLLPISVGAPEVSHILVVIALAGALLALTVRRRWLARIALVIAIPAVGLPALVLVQIPGTIRAFDAAMRDAGVGPAMPTAPPIDLRTLFTGLPRPDVSIARGLVFATTDGKADALSTPNCRTDGRT